MRKIILASSNPGKLKEFNQLFSSLSFQVVPQSEYAVDDVEETGETFVENAILKARHACKMTGFPAVADDSGLIVDSLNGAPGVYSARYAGPACNSKANIEKLLLALKDVPEENRSARFYSCLVFMRHNKDASPIIAEGVWEGRILFSPQGSDGFGYDPVFYVPEKQCSSAELALDEKNQLSHRGKAMRLLLDAVTATLLLSS